MANLQFPGKASQPFLEVDQPVEPIFCTSDTLKSRYEPNP
jgi:hypothetical protein